MVLDRHSSSSGDTRPLPAKGRVWATGAWGSRWGRQLQRTQERSFHTCRSPATPLSPQLPFPPSELRTLSKQTAQQTGQAQGLSSCPCSQHKVE